MGDTYYSEYCPECGKKNFWYAGDPSDIAGIDTEALICWKCGYKWLLPESEESGILLEDAYVEKGEKKIK